MSVRMETGCAKMNIATLFRWMSVFVSSVMLIQWI